MKPTTQNMVYGGVLVLSLWLIFFSKPKKEKCCGMPA